MGIYDDDIASAATDIQDAGLAVTYKVLTITKDNIEPWKEVGITYTNYSIYGFIAEDKTSPIKVVDKSTRNVRKDVGLLENEMLLYIPGNVEFTPKIKDIVTVGSVDYKVIDVDRLAPNNEPILYILKIKK